MFDAIHGLVARSKLHKELQSFHEFHREHPEVLAFCPERGGVGPRLDKHSTLQNDFENKIRKMNR